MAPASTDVEFLSPFRMNSRTAWAFLLQFSCLLGLGRDGLVQTSKTHSSVYPSFHLSIHPSSYLTAHSRMDPSVHLHIIHLSIHPSSYPLKVHLLIHLCIIHPCLLIHPLFHLLLYPSIHSSTHILATHLSYNPSFHSSIIFI